MTGVQLFLLLHVAVLAAIKDGMVLALAYLMC